MITVLEDLLNFLLVLGTSLWGWAGVVFGLLAGWGTWHFSPLSWRAPAAAFAFFLVFMVLAWQESRRRRARSSDD